MADESRTRSPCAVFSAAAERPSHGVLDPRRRQRASDVIVSAASRATGKAITAAPWAWPWPSSRNRRAGQDMGERNLCFGIIQEILAVWSPGKALALGCLCSAVQGIAIIPAHPYLRPDACNVSWLRVAGRLAEWPRSLRRVGLAASGSRGVRSIHWQSMQG